MYYDFCFGFDIRYKTGKFHAYFHGDFFRGRGYEVEKRAYHQSNRTVSFSMLNSPLRQNPKKFLKKIHFWRLAGQKTAGFCDF